MLWLLYDEYYPTNSLIQCLRVFHILVYACLLSCCYCYNHYKIPKILLLLSFLCYRYHHYHITVLLITLLQIFNLQVWLNWQTQLLILTNILCLPLCWILYHWKLLRSPILVGYQWTQLGWPRLEWRRCGLEIVLARVLEGSRTRTMIRLQRIYNFLLFHVVILSILDVL